MYGGVGGAEPRGSPLSRSLAHRTRHGRRPRRLLTKCTPAAGVPRPIIGSCDNVPHVRDTHRWRPLCKSAQSPDATLSFLRQRVPRNWASFCVYSTGRLKLCTWIRPVVHFLVLLVTTLFSVVSASAIQSYETIYYTGVDFTLATGLYATSDHITGRLDFFPSELPANSTTTIIAGSDGGEYLFTDGVQIISYDSGTAAFTFTTNAQDQIVSFTGVMSCYVYNICAPNCLSTPHPCTVSGPLGVLTINSVTGDTASYYVLTSFASNTLPGSWSISAAVPEPPAWAMILLGFAVVGFSGSRRKKKFVLGLTGQAGNTISPHRRPFIP
jgi:hypothetical protein